MIKVGDEVLYTHRLDARQRKGLVGVVTLRDLITETIRVSWADGAVMSHEEGYLKLLRSANHCEEYTGGSSGYYTVEIANPTSGGSPYTAECNDIIEALGMNYAEGNAFKAIWRRAAQRTLGKKKKGADESGLYDAEKIEFFGKRLVEQSRAAK